jgi:hypothetical protein
MEETAYSYETAEMETGTEEPAVTLFPELRKEIETNFFDNEKKVRYVLKQKLCGKDDRLADHPNLADKIDELAQDLFMMMLRKGITDSVKLAYWWGSYMGNPVANLRRTEVGGYRDLVQDVFLDDIPEWDLEAEIDSGLGYGGEARVSPKNWSRPVNDDVVRQMEQLAILQSRLAEKPSGEQMLTAYSMVKSGGMAEWLAEEACGCSWGKIRNTVRKECRKMGINLLAPEEGSRVRYSKKVQAGNDSMKKVADQKRERKLTKKAEMDENTRHCVSLSQEICAEYSNNVVKKEERVLAAASMMLSLAAAPVVNAAAEETTAPAVAKRPALKLIKGGKVAGMPQDDKSAQHSLFSTLEINFSRRPMDLPQRVRANRRRHVAEQMQGAMARVPVQLGLF